MFHVEHYRKGKLMEHIEKLAIDLARAIVQYVKETTAHELVGEVIEHPDFTSAVEDAVADAVSNLDFDIDIDASVSVR
jgi:hypothetical protein